jgi:hypothetical protein
MYCLAFLYIIIALVRGSYYANAGKSALKGRIEKKEQDWHYLPF